MSNVLRLAFLLVVLLVSMDLNVQVDAIEVHFHHENRASVQSNMIHVHSNKKQLIEDDSSSSSSSSSSTDSNSGSGVDTTDSSSDTTTTTPPPPPTTTTSTTSEANDAIIGDLVTVLNGSISNENFQQLVGNLRKYGPCHGTSNTVGVCYDIVQEINVTRLGTQDILACISIFDTDKQVSDKETENGVVYCPAHTQIVYQKEGEMNFHDEKIQYIQDLPVPLQGTDSKWSWGTTMDGNKMQKTWNFTSNKITEMLLPSYSYDSIEVLQLRMNEIKSVSAIDTHKMPSLRYLGLEQNQLDSFNISRKQLHHSAKIKYVNIAKNPLSSIYAKDLTKLSTLVAFECPQLVSTKNIQLPEQLKILDLSMNPQIEDWSDFKFPRDLETIFLSDNGIKDVGQLNFTHNSKLELIDLSYNAIESFKGISLHYKSDHKQQNQTDTTKNTTKNTKKKKMSTFELDLRGNPLYYIEFRASDVLLLNENTSKLRLPEDFPVLTTCETPNAWTLQIQKSHDNGPIIVCVLSDEAFDKRYVLLNNDAKDQRSMDFALETVSIIVAGSFVFVALVLLVRFYFKRQEIKAKLAYNIDQMDSLDNNSHHHHHQEDTLVGIVHDIRDDPDIQALRIDQEEIVHLKPLAKGGYGIIYLGMWLSEEKQIIVKRMLPEKSNDQHVINRFMNEIRICSKLDHPKIVKFLGLSWSNLLDMAVLMEYMSNGDLYQLLCTQRPLERHLQRFTWLNSTSEFPRSKLQIALDIVEALVYLHSFQRPIVHRDLKAKNVLLSSQYEAKLSDFGVSKELDDQMTAEIGTVAWIAPEVLKGEKYTEKADMYSFGVIMSEMDTCQKPYTHLVQQDGHLKTTPKSLLPNAKIALQVTEGKLQPDFDPDCPVEIKQLALQCLHFDQEKRPQAMKIHYELRQLLKASIRSPSENVCTSIEI